MFQLLCWTNKQGERLILRHPSVYLSPRLFVQQRPCIGRLDRIAHRKWRETKEHPSRATSSHQISCSLVSLHFLCNILPSHPIMQLFWMISFYDPSISGQESSCTCLQLYFGMQACRIWLFWHICRYRLSANLICRHICISEVILSVPRGSFLVVLLVMILLKFFKRSPQCCRLK